MGERKQPSSKLVAWYEYDSEEMLITVKYPDYKGGAIWSYSPVDAALLAQLEAAPSFGSFFIREIRDNPSVTATRVG